MEPGLVIYIPPAFHRMLTKRGVLAYMAKRRGLYIKTDICVVPGGKTAVYAAF